MNETGYSVTPYIWSQEPTVMRMSVTYFTVSCNTFIVNYSSELGTTIQDIHVSQMHKLQNCFLSIWQERVYPQSKGYPGMSARTACSRSRPRSQLFVLELSSRSRIVLVDPIPRDIGHHGRHTQS